MTMLRPPRAAFLPALLLALLLSACATTGGESHQAAKMTVRHVNYVLQPLDYLTVQAPDKTVSTLNVDSDGNVTLPDGQLLPLQGKASPDARALVEQKWKGAKVTQVNQFHGDRISVLGEVQRPANIPIAETSMTVMDAIAGTGGFTNLANTRKVTVLRQNADEVKVFIINAADVMKGRNVEQNIFLESGDIVTVPRSFL